MRAPSLCAIDGVVEAEGGGGGLHMTVAKGRGHRGTPAEAGVGTGRGMRHGPPLRAPPLCRAMAVAPAEGGAQVLVRPYGPQDYPEIQRICAHVYGGTDYMPKMVREEMAQNDTDLLCWVLEERPSGCVRATAAIRLQSPGHYFLLGVRVDPEVRGKGVREPARPCQCGCVCAPACVRTCVRKPSPLYGSCITGPGSYCFALANVCFILLAANQK